ncbi:MAG: sugar phosphate isomerase/epimerase family protein [Phycisphaeraceae bacterium]
MALPIGLQLFTVRNELETDLVGTLEQLAEIGYTHVEPAGLYGRTATELRQILDDAGLKAPGIHVLLDKLQENLPEHIETAKTLGCEMLVCPWLAPEMRNAEGFKRLADLLNQFQPEVEAAGLELVHHNHDFEIAPLDGTTGMDIVMENVSDKVGFELDLCWVARAGGDPMHWVEKLAGRLPAVHVKDMDAEKNFAEVGTGVLDLASLAKAAAERGTRYWIIEQDNNWKVSPLDSARESYGNFTKMIAE